MAEIAQLKTFLDAYGVGVRAGALTPQMTDEIYIRDLMDLPPMSPQALAYWAETDGVRKPLTIKVDEEQPTNAAPLEGE